MYIYLRLRSYHGECTGSRPLSEVKLRWAGVVLWWETTREWLVLQASIFFSSFFTLRLVPHTACHLCSRVFLFPLFHLLVLPCRMILFLKTCDQTK